MPLGAQKFFSRPPNCTLRSANDVTSHAELFCFGWHLEKLAHGQIAAMCPLPFALTAYSIISARMCSPALPPSSPSP